MPVAPPPLGDCKNHKCKSLHCPTSPVVGRDIDRRIILTTQKVRQRYELWNEDDTTLEIVLEDDASPSIELFLEKQEVDTWKIIPLSSPSMVLIVAIFIPISNYVIIFQIYKASIRNYKIGKRIPHCGFEFCLLKSDDSAPRLSHKVDVKGISPHGCSLHLRYPQPSSLVPQVGEFIT